jgi:hypothetical protein
MSSWVGDAFRSRSSGLGGKLQVCGVFAEDVVTGVGELSVDRRRAGWSDGETASKFPEKRKRSEGDRSCLEPKWGAKGRKSGQRFSSKEQLHEP